MSRSPTIIDPDDWLHNAHAGQMLLSEFLEPLDMTPESLATLVAVSAERLQAIVDGSIAIDAEIDLRLGRYFGLSEGFFLRLQDDYELLEAKRALNGELDRIVPRAA